ncbi:hypothetical protein CCACVL1_08751 [Corchorus capsularis]|uniref:Uncharacterized protein n=1 Tax=Corchorus capsularis TaxID=210143 RepID=A0A1R3IYY1_COCAP|nr:hypothetical protein CCACVL1_08751 [Corchorus capsularis]
MAPTSKARALPPQLINGLTEERMLFF